MTDTASAVSRAYGQVAPDMEHAASLPPEAYLSPEVFEAEVEHVFRREWLAVARAEQLAKPGDYLSLDLFGHPLMLVRGQDGAIRALSRVCRHRAMPVAEGAGNAKSFTCPYHLWRYGLDGALLTAPAMEQSALFDAKSCALPSFPVEVWQGFVFVNLDPDARPLAPRLAGLDAFLRGQDLSTFRIGKVLDYPSPWNWKVMIDNFMESYHHVGTHAQTLQPVNSAFDTYAREVNEGSVYSVLENPPATDEAHHLTVFSIYPSGLFAVQEGDVPVAIWGRLDIERHDFFTFRIHVLLPEAACSDKELVEGAGAVMGLIHEEDMAACRGVQAGLASPDFAPGPLSHLERALWQFQRFMAQRVAA